MFDLEFSLPKSESANSVEPGKFITFEGCDGSGKSTQLRNLARQLRTQGIDVVETREPGGTPKAEAIRELLLSGKVENQGAKAEAMMFSVARLDHVDQLIRPSLQAGKWVLCDRFIDSTRVFQGSEMEKSDVDLLEEVAINGLYPDLTILLDLPAEDLLDRINRREGDAPRDRFEKEDISKHDGRRRLYLEVAKSNAERFFVLDGTKFPWTIEKSIWQEVQNRFELDEETSVQKESPTAAPEAP